MLTSKYTCIINDFKNKNDKPFSASLNKQVNKQNKRVAYKEAKINSNYLHQVLSNMNSVISEYRIAVCRKRLHGNSFTVTNTSLNFFLRFGPLSLKYIALCTHSKFLTNDHLATEIITEMGIMLITTI